MKKTKLTIFLVFLMIFTLAANLMIFAEEEMYPNLFFAESQEAHSLIDAYNSNKRIDIKHTFKPSIKLFEENDLLPLFDLISDLSIDISLQEDKQNTTLADINIAYKDDTLYESTFWLTDKDLFMNSTLLPNRTLAFTPQEILNFITTVMAEVDDDNDDLFLFNIYSDAITELIDENTTWKDLEDLSELLDIADFNFDFDFLDDIPIDSLPDLDPLLKDLEKWWENQIVDDPVVTNIKDYPVGSDLTQYIIDTDSLIELTNILAKWIKDKSFYDLMLLFDSEDLDLDMDYETYKEVFVPIFLEELNDILTEAFIYPISISIWTHTTAADKKNIDQLVVHIPIKIDDYDEDGKITLFLEYNAKEDTDSKKNYFLSLGAFDEENRFELSVNASPKFIQTLPDKKENISANMDISFMFLNVYQGEVLFKTDYRFSVEQQQINSQEEFLEKWLLLFEANGDEDTSDLVKEDGFRVSFKKQSDTKISKTRDVSSLSNYVILYTDDLDSSLSEEIFAWDRSIQSSAGEDIVVPKENLVRLGKMNAEELEDWIEDLFEDLDNEIERVFSILPEFD